MNNSLISIKGTAVGLSFAFDTSQAGFHQICLALEEKLLHSGDFFLHAAYTIADPGVFTLEELAIIEDILEKYSLVKYVPVTESEISDDHHEIIYHTSGGNAVLLAKSIRGGQKVSARGSAVICGDVNPGAEIVATGNIVIMGTCRGMLHAGAEGDNEAYILAYTLAAQQLRIGEYVATVPEGLDNTPLKLVKVHDGHIIITEYISSQFAVMMDFE
ncbi:MAG: septum site-determining protein MinC [Bacillota bacterium]|nr:septum site-determining protein MinC [Bacillota bacterium]